MLRLLPPPVVQFLRSNDLMDKPFRTSRSTNLKSTERIDRDNSLFAICRTPPKIQIEPKYSFASGLLAARHFELFPFRMLDKWLLAGVGGGWPPYSEQRIAFLPKNSYPLSAEREEPEAAAAFVTTPSSLSRVVVPH